MTTINVVRIAKVIALLAFILPWVAVSCSVPGQGAVDIATASGIELIQGKMTANPDFEKQMQGQMGGILGPDARASTEGGGASMETEKLNNIGMNFFAVGAAAAILIGLLLTFVAKDKAAGRNALITSLIGAALVFATVWWWKDQMKKQDAAESQTSASAEDPFGGGAGNPFGGAGGMGGMGQEMIDSMLQERFGYWIALGGLIVAAGAGAIGMAGGVAGLNRDPTKPPG